MLELMRLVERWQTIRLPDLDERFLVLALALLAAATVYTATRTWRFSWGRSPERLLADYYAVQEATGEPRRGLTVDKEAIILMSLGLPPRQGLLDAVRLTAAGSMFLILLLMRYPPLLAAALSAVGYALVNGFLDGRWHAFRMSVERDLPLVAARLSGVLQIVASPVQALESVVETLPDDRPARAFLERVLVAARSQGPRAFAEAREAAMDISPSLATVLLLMSRLAETGGAAYGQAFLSVADELFAIARVRAVAASKAHAARLNLYVILAALTMGSIVFLNTPSLRGSLNDPLVQMVQAGAVGVLLFGFKFINDMIRRSMEV